MSLIAGQEANCDAACARLGVVFQGDLVVEARLVAEAWSNHSDHCLHSGTAHVAVVMKYEATQIARDPHQIFESIAGLLACQPKLAGV